MVRVVGLRPFVGHSSVTGFDLVEPPTAAGVSVAAVVGAVLLVGAWWARRRDPRLTALVGCVAALALAGVLTGANVPDSLEEGRLNFFHRAFALSVLELLALGWLAALAVQARPPSAPVGADGPRTTRGPAEAPERGGSPGARIPVVAGAAAAALVTVAAVVPVALDRDGDRLSQPVRREVVERFVDQIEADPALEQDGPLLTLVAGDDRFVQIADTVRVRLVAAGHDVRFGPDARGFVHPDRLLDPCQADRALIVGLGSGSPRDDLGGRRIAEVEVAPEVDLDALDRLAGQAEGRSVDLGPELQAALRRLPGDLGALRGSSLVFGLGASPEKVFRNRCYVDLFLDHPPAAPILDRADLLALRDSFPDDVDTIPFTHITADLVDRDQLRVLRPELTTDCP